MYVPVLTQHALFATHLSIFLLRVKYQYHSRTFYSHVDEKHHSFTMKAAKLKQPESKCVNTCLLKS